MTNIRPQNGSDDRFYSPHRDVAHLGVPLMRRVFDELGEPKGSVDEFCRTFRVTEEDLGEVAVAVAKFFNLVPDVTAESYQAAWERAGLAALELEKPAAVHVFLMVAGRRLLVTCFNGARDLTEPGEDRGYAALLARGRDLALWASLPRLVRAVVQLVPRRIGLWVVRRWAAPFRVPEFVWKDCG